MLKRFKKFLRECRCEESYYENMRNAKNTEEGIFAEHETSWINYAFNWSQTPQGHSYWSNLNRAWHKAITEYETEQER